MNITLISLDDVYGLGNRLLASVLKQNGYKVNLLFLPTKWPFWAKQLYPQKVLDDLVELCRDSKLIGLSVATISFLRAKQITDYLKINLEIPIIWGGYHPTGDPYSSLRYADVVCIGEGEEAVCDLTKSLKVGKIDYKVKNLWFKKDGDIIKNEVRHPIENLDNLPFPDYDSSSHYILQGKRITSLTKKLMKSNLWRSKNGLAKYMEVGSRGCPFSCSFCYTSLLDSIYGNKNRYNRKSSIDNIIKKLKNIVLTNEIFEFIDFCDSTFTYRSLDELKYFSQEYIKNINLPFGVFFDPNTYSEEKFRYLIKAGLKEAYIGIQSFDNKTNFDIYNRPVSSKRSLQIIHSISRYKDYLDMIAIDLIVNNPWETKESLTNTIRTVAGLPSFIRMWIYPLKFHPGTRLYYKAKEEGLINDFVKNIVSMHFSDYNFMKTDYLSTLLFLISRLRGKDKFRNTLRKILLTLTNKKYVKIFCKATFFLHILVFLMLLKQKIMGIICRYLKINKKISS